MRKINLRYGVRDIVIGFLIVCCYIPNVQGEESVSVAGIWVTIDDETQKPKSHLKIWKENGQLNGKIVELLDSQSDNPLCVQCRGDLHNKPIKGLKILWGLQADNDGWWDNGYIIDPNNGKTYRCKLRLIDEGQRLEVRGYIGFSVFGRSQTWLRKSVE